MVMMFQHMELPKFTAGDERCQAKESARQSSMKRQNEQDKQQMTMALNFKQNYGFMQSAFIFPAGASLLPFVNISI